ncbi:hypothetical protein DSO57_1006659 [Entomophthora muscae]|uniref:Uncharacterized protein n=1 Tax=Entomophthora muscae TaxID=34485 RepID=A0ACC2SWT0_9FUNG|nr:hypothetical protein DSO57_1006659 [Entomophthora muscae]
MLFWLIQLLSYFVFAIYQFNSRSSGPPALLPAVYCPPGAPFGPVHFTDYPLKPKYKGYTPEKILKLDPLACIQSAIRYNRQGLVKFNYLPAYNIHMNPPMIPKYIPAYLPDLPTDHTSKIFGIVYITLTGAIDTIIPAASLWFWVGKSALPAKTPAYVTPENSRQATQDWVPDKIPLQQARFQVGDKTWVVNQDQHKLKTGLHGPGIVMEVKPNNTYLIKGISTQTELKKMHNDCFHLCKARTAQHNSRIPVCNNKLEQYQALVP